MNYGIFFQSNYINDTLIFYFASFECLKWEEKKQEAVSYNIFAKYAQRALTKPIVSTSFDHDVPTGYYLRIYFYFSLVKT